MRSTVPWVWAFLLMFGGGPLRAQTWVQKIAGPGLGNPLTVNPLNSDILYGAAGGNRLYVSRDRGYTWANFGGLVTGGGIIKSLSVSPLDTSHFLAGMESNVGEPDRIMKSTDAGLTWDTTWTGSFSYFGQPVEFSPLHPDTVYTMGLDTLFRSVDFGSTWDTVASGRGFNAWCDAAIRPDSAAVMYLGDNLSGIWKTVDHGSSWRKVYSTLGEIPSIAIDPHNPAVSYAGKFGGGGGLVKSTDWGETWHTLTVPSGNRDAWWVVCSPDHPGRVYYGTYTGDTARLGIYLSRDAGGTWERLNQGLPQSAIFNYGLLTLDSLTLIALQGSGIFKYQYPTTIDVTSPAGGEYLLTGDTATITWTAAGLYLVRIEYSSDNGAGWTLLSDSIPASQNSFYWVTPALPSESCLVRISDALFTATSGVSASVFTLTDSYLTLGMPNGGEVWDAGSVHPIGWTSVSIDSLQIDYSADSGASWNLITRLPAAAWSFNWTIPKDPTPLALVRLRGVEDSSVTDISDGVFTIRHISTFTADILVTDAGAGSGTLTFGLVSGATEGIDTLLGEAELPPAPGTGTFDARWTLAGSNGLSLDVRDTLQGEGDSRTFRLALQPGAGGYPLTLSWEPDSLQGGAFIMRDSAGPDALVNLNMRQDGELVLTDSSVHSLDILACAGTGVVIPGDGGWILTSLPVETGDHRAVANFPLATGGAFEFLGGYIRRDTLVPGRGYWIKTPQVILAGCPLPSGRVVVRPGWNIIGAPTHPMAVSGLATEPESLIISPLFSYGQGGYFAADSLIPGAGYWVKCRDSGAIILEGATARGKVADLSPWGEGGVNRLLVSAPGWTGAPGMGADSRSISTLYFGPGERRGSVDSPPAPPSGRLAALFENSKIGVIHADYPKYPIEYEITLNTTENEILFYWNVEIHDNFNYILVEYNDSREVSAIPLAGSGSTTVKRSRGSKFFLTVHLLNSGSLGVPRDFSMGRFYPNPFNPTARVHFQLPFESIISYNICNLLGETVISSDGQHLGAGEHSITWDGRRDDGTGVGSGVYFMTFTAKPVGREDDRARTGFRAVRKLLLVR